LEAQPKLHAGPLILQAMLPHGLSDRTRMTWMPEALRILHDELPNIDVMISSQYSPLLRTDY